MTDPDVLVATDVSHAFGMTRALDGVSLSVARDECVALVGESGSGKTTLMRCFNALVRPDRGAVRTLGEDVAHHDAVALRRRVGYVPQHGGLLPHWTVWRNAALVPALAARADAATRVGDALALAGVDATLHDRLPHELSGGQRQRVALARALADHPPVVLLDEPFGALDAISRVELHDALIALRTQRTFAALLVTHDLAEAARLADRIAVMRDGRIEQCATWETLRHAPATPYVASLLARARRAAASVA